MKKLLLISFVLIVAFLSVKGFAKNLNAVTEDGRKVILKADGIWEFLIDQEADDPVSMFKRYISKHLNSYSKNKRERMARLGGGWVKEYYEPEQGYSFDVQKTSSLVTPYTAFCEFVLVRHFTDFHTTRESAIQDSNFIKTDKLKHRHTYGFQEGKWIVTSRFHQMFIPAQFKDISTLDEEWFDCNQVIPKGENKGATNIKGCWEENLGPSQSIPEPQPTKETIPKDVTYSIIDTKVVPRVKRSLDIRLNRKVSENVLRLIALQLKSQDTKEYERTFITYYLPDMKLGAGAWATTHFNPSLNIRILGLTVEQEKNLLSEATDSSRKVIGIWLDESPVIGSKFILYRQNDKLYMERVFGNGSSSNEEMVKKTSSSGQRFEEKTSSSSGDYYLINTRGDLEMRDQVGLVATARRVK